jgi:predicted site-specific integrase-resolvase
VTRPVWRPIWAVAEYLGRSQETVRTWRKSGRLASTTDASGRIVVDLAQAAELNEHAARRQRKLTT